MATPPRWWKPMLDATSPFEAPGAKVDGSAEIGFAHRDGQTRLAHLYQHEPLRVLFPAPAKGDVLELVISADLAAVSDTAGEYENMITGELISEEFIGSVITLYIDIGEGTVFRVQKQQHELDALGYTASSKLFASWRPEDTYILPPA